MSSVTATVNFKADGVCSQRNLVQLHIKRDLHPDQPYQAETTMDRLDPEWVQLVPGEDPLDREETKAMLQMVPETVSGSKQAGIRTSLTSKYFCRQPPLTGQWDGRDKTKGRLQLDRQLHHGDNGDVAAWEHPALAVELAGIS